MRIKKKKAAGKKRAATKKKAAPSTMDAWSAAVGAVARETKRGGWGLVRGLVTEATKQKAAWWGDDAPVEAGTCCHYSARKDACDCDSAAGGWCGRNADRCEARCGATWCAADAAEAPMGKKKKKTTEKRPEDGTCCYWSARGDACDCDSPARGYDWCGTSKGRCESSCGATWCPGPGGL